METANNPLASASLYVGDLPSDATETTLFELFNAVGAVASIRVCRDAATRRSLGYAYINFHSIKDAERALDTINFTNISGNQCRIMWSQRDPRLRQSGKGNIFVKNLHASIDNKTLYDTFSVFGNILSCKVVIDDSQKSRGYGYVHYVDDKAANKAIEGVNGMMIAARKVHAELFKPREQRIKDYKYTNVYVKYIPNQWDEAMLTKIFEECTGGKIDKLEMWRHDYGVSACLNFDSSQAAKSAVEKLNGKDVNSFDFQVDDAHTTKLYVARAQKRKERKQYLQKQKLRAKQKRLRSGADGAGLGRKRGSNLYVKNLSADVDDAKLHEMFVNFGAITSAKVMCEADGKSRMFGFVAFAKKEAAARAIQEMKNTLHGGKTLYVSKAQTKAFRKSFIRKQLQNNRKSPRRPTQSAQSVHSTRSRPEPPMQALPAAVAAQIQMQMSYGMTNPLLIQQQQQLAAQQALLIQQQQQLAAAKPHSHSQRSPVQPVQSQAQSMQSGPPLPPSASMFAGSQQMVVPSSTAASQPHQSSVPMSGTFASSVSMSQLSTGTGGQTSAPMLEVNPLTSEMLQDAKPAEKKRLIGERLFPKIQVVEPRLAGKITGMLLEMDNTELLVLLSEEKALMHKINEALAVLKDHQQRKSQSNPASSGPGAGSSLIC